jgi:hypothetical protein
MDLIELARTIQADRDRAIATETRRRRFMSAAARTLPATAAKRPTEATQRPASTAVPTR